MAIGRRDEWVTDAQGNAISGCLVYYCTQPANTGSLPPSPLATVYSDTAGSPAANPQITDGFGHAVAYLDESALYTIEYVHPLFGSNPIILSDQQVGGSPTTFEGIPAGTVDGVNRVFTLTNGGTPISITPQSVMVWRNFPLVNTVGYTLAGVVVTYSVAPTGSDTLYAQGWY